MSGEKPRVSDDWVKDYAAGRHLVYRDLALDLQDARAEVARLGTLINTPHTYDFLVAVRLEAAHQRDRWAAEIEAGKTDADWFWLIGHLAGKAIHKPEKLLHHIVTTAAACLNWHMQRTVGNDMRSGIETKEPT